MTLPWITKKVRVKRTTTESADIEFSVDRLDYEQWLGGLVPTHRTFVEYIRSDGEYPANLPLDGANWVEEDVEIEVRSIDPASHVRR